jgi:hypothetical protein
VKPTEEIAVRLVGGAQSAYVQELSYFFLNLLDEVVRTNGAVIRGREIADFERLSRLSREEALAIYYKYRPAIDKQTREVLKTALKKTDDALVGQFVRAMGSRRHMTNLATIIAAQTAQGMNEVLERQNIALAKDQAALWYDVTAEAIARHQAGEPTRAVMERGVTRLANSGLETIDYISGTKTTIDAALRRHIVSQANQARNRLLMQRMDEWEWDLVFVDAHFGARPSHAEWQGKVYSRSGRSTEYPSLVESTGYGTVTGLCGANCVVGDTKVSGPYASAAYRRKYSGQIVTIRTALGHNLTVTPNHPILTPQGWVAASQLKKGDYVFSRVNRDRMPLGVRPDKYECEPTIKQEFDSLRDTFGIRTFLGSSANFHNDGIANQNVDVVLVDSSLVDDIKTKRFKHIAKSALFNASRLSDCGLGLGSFTKVSMCFPTTSYSILRMFTKSPSLFQRTSRHSSFGSHSSILRENSSFLKSISNCRLGNTKLLSNNSFIEPFIPKINDTFDINTLLTSIGLQAKSFEFAGDNPIPASEMLPHGPDRSSFIVEPDKVVSIDIRMWSGHVYNLSTENAWYFANSIVTHNCYHYMTPYVPGYSELPDMDYSEQERITGMTSDEYYAATQKQRRYERLIRSQKREISYLQEVRADAVKQRIRLGELQDKLRQFTHDNHLSRDYERERAWAVSKQPRALETRPILARQSKNVSFKGSFKDTKELMKAYSGKDVNVPGIFKERTQVNIDFSQNDFPLNIQKQIAVASEHAFNFMGDSIKQPLTFKLNNKLGYGVLAQASRRDGAAVIEVSGSLFKKKVDERIQVIFHEIAHTKEWKLSTMKEWDKEVNELLAYKANPMDGLVQSKLNQKLETAFLNAGILVYYDELDGKIQFDNGENIECLEGISPYLKEYNDFKDEFGSELLAESLRFVAVNGFGKNKIADIVVKEALSW